MPLCRFQIAAEDAPRLGLVIVDQVWPIQDANGPTTLAEILALPVAQVRSLLETIANAGQADSIPLLDLRLLAPIDRQEVWAAGVTYRRSRDARMEESTQKDVYDLVYDADRPEIFLKATANRVSGPDEAIAIRGDSTWDVPEPELALVINRHGETIGYTIGNDVSSRSIEGENPLYLPQAKVYDRCAALGPVIALAWEQPEVSHRAIRLRIRRDGHPGFSGETSTDQLHRGFADLVGYLRRYNQFPDGVILMTGTGIVPPADFTLEGGDQVEIEIEGIGTLRNPVLRLTA